MNKMKFLIAVITALATTRTLVEAHPFSIAIWDYYGIPEGSTEIQVSDGVTWISVPLVAVEGDPTGEYDDEGNEILSNTRHIYGANVPNEWSVENRGVSFHLPGHGLTPFYPMFSAGETYNIDLGFTRRSSPNPNLNYTTVGNRVMLGQWWPKEAGDPRVLPPSVAKFIAWDNNNRYWPCVGVDSIASTGHAFWRWIHPEAGENVIAMDLDYLHRLTIRGRSNSANTLTLDPEFGQIAINGWAVVTAANAEAQLGNKFVSLSSATAQLAGQFVGRTTAGVNLAQSGGTLRSQSGLPAQVLLGARNDNRTNDAGTDHTQGVLIVGSSTQPGTNGLRILDDGTVLIWPKADLPMHTDFQKGPRP